MSPSSAYFPSTSHCVISVVVLSLQSKASLYGTHPWHWYFTQGLPAVLGPLLPLFLVGLRQNDKGPLVMAASLLVAWCMAGLSISPHKEFRFLLPIVPLCAILAGLGSQSLVGRFPYLVKCLVWANLPLAWYLGRCHQRGPIDVMDYLSQCLDHDATNTNHTWIDFLVSCHSTPYYSYLHPPLHHSLQLSMLDCSPQGRLSEGGSETDRFLISPQTFLTTTRYPRGALADLPHYVVVFDSAATLLASTFSEWGYQQQASFFYSSIKTDMDAPTQENNIRVYGRRRK